MSCLNPIVLKSGIVVPCGKCDLCHSDQRTQWSVRLGIHASYSDRMPLFICLTYDNDNLPFVYKSDNNEFYFSRGFPSCELAAPSLYREDISQFMKSYKRKYNLLNDKFTYFGCGEYGDTFGRPHYHLLFFGDDELYDLFYQDTNLAEQRLMSVWQKGFVSIGIAQWSGIHYVTKYILKDEIDVIRSLGVVEPFLVASKGLGSSFYNSELATEWSKRLQWLSYNSQDLYNSLPDFSIDSVNSIDVVLDSLRPFMPSWKVPLDDGRFVYLPRVMRKRLIGSFEHWRDNPCWLYDSLLRLRKSIDYYRLNGEYDMTHDVESWKPALQNRVQKIKQRLGRRKYDNLFKHSKK